MKKNFKRIIGTLLSSFLILSLIGCGESEEIKAAKDSFSQTAEKVTTEIDEANEEIQKAEDLLASEEPVLDESLKPALETAIASLKAKFIEVPEMPSKQEEIEEETRTLKAFNDEAELENLKKAEDNLIKSQKQYQLVNNPTEASVIERLKNVDSIQDIAAVTEDTDENGLLNKSGGYVARVIFSSPDVDQSSVIGDTLTEKGTQAGGAIEVYPNAEDASKRNTYLAAFDGTPLDSGSHTVIGTVVVRTSDLLTASKQKELEQKIVDSLTHLDE